MLRLTSLGLVACVWSHRDRAVRQHLREPEDHSCDKDGLEKIQKITTKPIDAGEGEEYLEAVKIAVHHRKTGCMSKWIEQMLKENKVDDSLKDFKVVDHGALFAFSKFYSGQRATGSAEQLKDELMQVALKKPKNDGCGVAWLQGTSSALMQLSNESAIPYQTAAARYAMRPTSLLHASEQSTDETGPPTDCSTIANTQKWDDDDISLPTEKYKRSAACYAAIRKLCKNGDNEPMAQYIEWLARLGLTGKPMETLLKIDNLRDGLAPWYTDTCNPPSAGPQNTFAQLKEEMMLINHPWDKAEDKAIPEAPKDE